MYVMIILEGIRGRRLLRIHIRTVDTCLIDTLNAGDRPSINDIPDSTEESDPEKEESSDER